MEQNKPATPDPKLLHPKKEESVVPQIDPENIKTPTEKLKIKDATIADVGAVIAHLLRKPVKKNSLYMFGYKNC